MKSPIRWFAPALIATALLAAALGWWLRGRFQQTNIPSDGQSVAGKQGDGQEDEPKEENAAKGPEPIIAIVAEAPGMSPEEVELAVALPIETQVNGMPGVREVRSASRAGTCTIWVDLEPKTDIFEARQGLAERVQRAELPLDVTPMLAPISFAQRDVLLVGLRSQANQEMAEAQTRTGMELRTLAEHVVRQRLLTIPGVSQVIVTGGVRKRCQVELDPDRMVQFGVTLRQVEEALKNNIAVGAGGHLDRGDRELSVVLRGKSPSLQDLETTLVLPREERPVRIGDVAKVRFGGPDAQGDAAIWTREGAGNGPAVILTVLRGPNLDGSQMDRLLAEVQQALPPDVKLERQTLAQEDVSVSLRLPHGTSREARDKVCRQVEAALAEIPEIRSVWRRAGLGETTDYLDRDDGPVLFIAIQRNAERGREAVLADIRGRIAAIPALSAHLGRPASHRSGGVEMDAPIAVKVFGPDLQVLQLTAEEIQAGMGMVPGIMDMQVEPRPDREQLHLEVKREEAARHGVSVADLAATVQTVLEGRVVGTILHEGRPVDLVIVYEEKLRSDAESLGKLSVETPTGMRIPLDRLAEFRLTAGPVVLYREKVQRRVVVSCTVQGRGATAVLKDIREKLKPVEERLNQMPGGYRIEYAGSATAK
jgi:Cu/Ag efflux pump CusA